MRASAVRRCSGSSCCYLLAVQLINSQAEVLLRCFSVCLSEYTSVTSVCPSRLPALAACCVRVDLPVATSASLAVSACEGASVAFPAQTAACTLTDRLRLMYSLTSLILASSLHPSVCHSLIGSSLFAWLCMCAPVRSAVHF